MVKTYCVAVVATLLLVVASPALAGDDDDLSMMTNRDDVVAKFLAQLQSCDISEKQIAAFALGEARCTEAVVPLMKMLHDGPEKCRIVAALALCRMGEARGTFAVKQAARFDESERVRTLAAWYYDQYVQPGSFAFKMTPQETRQVAQGK